ncbi:hypothetical protein DOY81_009105, partial [Sarcophaga bullata]
HRYDHDHDHDHDNYHRHHQHQTQQQQQQLKQVETDLNRNLKKSKANIIRYERSNNGDDDDEDRLRKREISWHEYYQRIMQSQAINWYNPCGGISLRNETPVKRKKPPPIKKELRKLQSTVAKNYSFIKNHLRTINIQDMHEMEYFEKKYTFLPKLNANSSTLTPQQVERNKHISRSMGSSCFRTWSTEIPFRISDLKESLSNTSLQGI